MIEIIAHRGASKEFLENTLPAFARALELGADGIELDVHGSRDGAVVVHHDATVHTPDGLQHIAALDAAAIAALRLPDGSRIPMLDEVFELVGPRMTVYVEVKAAGIEGALTDCLLRHADARFAVHSFDHRIPTAIRHALPGTPIGFLSASYPLQLSALLGDTPPDALWQAGELLDRDLVEAAHAKGARVIAWTVNRPAHARALAEMGVDALCTDTPGLLRAGLTG